MIPLAALKSCALFKDFTDTGLQIISSVCNMKSFPKGTPLFAESMLGDSLIIIADGKVQLTCKGASGAEVSLGELGQGDYLGELALVHQGPRLCTATASELVTAVELRHADFQKLLAQKPQACLKLLMGILSAFGHKVVESRELLRAVVEKKS